MTITAFDIYLVSLADKIILPVSFIAMFAFGFSVIICVLYFAACETVAETKKTKTALKITIAITIVCGFITIFVPSSKTIAAMYVLPAIVNNEHIQNATGNTLEFLEKLTKDWLKDTIKEQDVKQGEANI